MADVATWISVGEATTGILSIGMGLVMAYAAYLSPNKIQRHIRLWLGVYFGVMGLEEFFDALFHEGDDVSVIPQVLCTMIQLVTSAGAVWFLLRIRSSQWQIDLRHQSERLRDLEKR